MSKQEALDAARRLVKEAVDVAGRAGVDPAEVVAPHCQGEGAAPGGPAAPEQGERVWCGVPWAVDDSATGLFEMPAPDDDPDQRPVFRVTASTAELVRQEFERYKPSLERMVEDWQEAKALHMQDKKSDERKRD